MRLYSNGDTQCPALLLLLQPVVCGVRRGPWSQAAPSPGLALLRATLRRVESVDWELGRAQHRCLSSEEHFWFSPPVAQRWAVGCELRPQVASDSH